MPEALLLEGEDAVAIISINDAPYNRMSLDFIDQLQVVVNEIATDDAIRAVVLTGEGEENFSVGMNLKQLPAGIERMGSPDALFDQRLRVIRGKRISGPEAQRIGLANEVWPLAELKERAIELAHELAAQPALAVRRRNPRLSKRPWALRMRRRE